MDYQIFTFSFKFFMVLLTMLSSPLFLICLFCMFNYLFIYFLFISYLLPASYLVQPEFEGSLTRSFKF